ncbi:uncharacterized protein B0I36DRAFT_331586 [Microdochium trichocladiopsis]|uniref:Uncharacterized protein n=1 Tax=Microdochium trichocladiopsis TaxID=1682393 RepID=A0A9P8XXR8_9PEZI|nr:uncharacterized protein B0I36DRAFT_331586 [Microdochium trichocladiopsis]KAH7024530.1 hypothetical protein B0I36DRAFT_331586 [Microdochium trichocladiopsis]
MKSRPALLFVFSPLSVPRFLYSDSARSSEHGRNGWTLLGSAGARGIKGQLGRERERERERDKGKSEKDKEPQRRAETEKYVGNANTLAPGRYTREDVELNGRLLHVDRI